MGSPTPPTTIDTDPPASMPAPRRIRMDATGWTLVREAAAAAGLAIDQLPETGSQDALRDRVREALVAADVLSEDGKLTATVYGAMAVLTTAAVTITVEHVTTGRAIQGLWRTLGLPTAGVVIYDRELDGTIHREVELQVLAGDDLLDVILTELATEQNLAHQAPDDQAFEVDADDLSALPSGVVVDGDLVARAAVTVSGPASSTVAQLVGDGGRWWQVGASGQGKLRWIPVDVAEIRGSLTSALTSRLAEYEAETAGGTDV